MKKDLIAEVGIDQTGRFYIKPSSIKFPYIYREAMEVNWDAKPLKKHILEWIEVYYKNFNK